MQEKEGVQEAPKSKLVEAFTGALIPLLSKFLRRFDVEDEDVQALCLSAGDRLVDIQALVHGGTLTTGEAVDGAVASEARLERIEAKLDRILKMADEVRS